METAAVVLGLLIIIALGGTWIYCTWKQRQHPSNGFALILAALAIILVSGGQLKSLVAKAPGVQLELTLWNQYKQLYEDYQRVAAVIPKTVSAPGQKEKLTSAVESIKGVKIPDRPPTSPEQAMKQILVYSYASSGTTKEILTALGSSNKEPTGKPFEVK
jgi:hypothetical protein